MTNHLGRNPVRGGSPARERSSTEIIIKLIEGSLLNCLGIDEEWSINLRKIGIVRMQ